MDAPASPRLSGTMQSIYLPEFSPPLRNMLPADPSPSSLSITTDTRPVPRDESACLVLQYGVSQDWPRGPRPTLPDPGSFCSAAHATKDCPGCLAVSGMLDVSGSVVALHPMQATYHMQVLTARSTNSDVGRTIEAAVLNADNMTIERCLAFCTDQFYPYAGVEYFEQCCKSPPLPQDLRLPVDSL